MREWANYLVIGMAMGVPVLPALSAPTTRPVSAAATRPARDASRLPGNAASPRSRRAGRREEADRGVLQPVSKEAQDRAMEITRKWVDKLSRACEIDFQVLETDHFLVYHNWDPREEGFIASNLEDCYRTISGQFGASARDRVFAGKAPIFMIDGAKPYAAAMRETSPEVDPNFIVGMAMTNSDGMACIVMQKPTKRGWEAPAITEKRWASTLAHEMTHLFAARYKTNVHLPTWLNEGLAKTMEAKLFPELYRRDVFVKSLNGTLDLSLMFGLQRPRSSHEYAAMQTMVETLLAANSQQFVRLVDAIKDGAKAEDALADVYGWSVDDFSENWLGYLREEYNVRPPR